MAKMYKDSKGYWRFADSGKPVHRWAAEKKIGRVLREHEAVHHRDENKSNFKSGNLAVVSKSFHAKIHAKKRNGSWFW